MKSWLFVGLVLACTPPLATNVVSAESQEVFGNGSQIADQKTAVQTALTYLGDVDLGSADTSLLVSHSKVLTFVDSTTPFLGEAFNGRRVWQVQIFNARLLAGLADEEFERSYPKDIYISLDSITGRLIEIRLLNHGTDKSFAELKPTRASAEGQIGANGENYKKLPENIPTRTFMQALKNVRHSPHLATEIVGIFVFYESELTPAAPLWIISIYGAPAWIPSRRARNVPVNQLNHSRTCVRDDNGHSWASNTPQPIEWPPPPASQRKKDSTGSDKR